MGRYGFAAFFGYVLLFVIGQQYIAHRYRFAKVVRASEAPGWVILMFFSICFLLLWVKTSKDQTVRYIPMAVGGIVILLGFALSMWAQWHLGQNWVGGIGLRKRHRLITSGPYRYVRHPLYSGMMVSAIGLGIFGWNILFLLMALCFSGAYTIRSIGEEFLLEKQFPKHYPPYAARTGKLLPHIRKRN